MSRQWGPRRRNLLDLDPRKKHPTDLENNNSNIMAAMPATGDADILVSSVDAKLLSSAILKITKRLDKLEENHSSKGQGHGKRPSPELQNNVPAKKQAKDCSSSTSEQNTSDNADIQTLMARVAGDDDEPGSEDEDETLTEMQKEDESEDSIGKIYKTRSFPSSLAKCFEIGCRIKFLKSSSSDKLDRKTVTLLNPQESTGYMA